ncbi:hypothetical protein BGX38DRAFT_1280641 [Terfezia claveryi]|nr:hypothetical protein BGX38DRAFT_1280641 [Terfezia claveryi]
MVTGIECAGLVLGVFPILITGIQAYSQGMSTITRARKYRSTLRQYSLDLSREYTVFRNTWFRIVQLVEFNSGGHLQNAPELNLQVLKEKPQKAVVGQKIDLKTILSLALQCFDDVGLNDIERTFEELSDLITRVAIDFHITAAVGVEDSMAIPDLVNCNLASASTEAGSKGYKARLKSLQKMLETGLSEGYRNEKLSQIREKNMFLSRLITGDTVAQTFAFVRDFPRSRTPINMGRGLVHTRLYNHIQDQAKSIHRALQRKFEPSTARCCGLGHRGLLQLEVRGISINTPPTAMNLKHVCYRFGLCFSFDRPTTRLGEVDSACELELGIMKEHEDSSGSNPSGDSTPKIVEQIGLAANGKSTEESKSRSNGKGKKGDVNACGNGSWSTTTAFTSLHFCAQGIVLIEIYHWERFEALENGRRKSQAVREIVTELFQNAGENYGLSVKTCVQGLPGIEMDLDHEGFKNEVYEKIVVPLEDNLKHFCRTKDLSTIFNSSTLQ